MYAHSSTFYLSRSGSKLIERPSYIIIPQQITAVNSTSTEFTHSS